MWDIDYKVYLVVFFYKLKVAKSVQDCECDSVSKFSRLTISDINRYFLMKLFHLFCLLCIDMKLLFVLQHYTLQPGDKTSEIWL